MFAIPASAPASQTGGGIRHVDFDPVTRVAGGLAMHAVIDLDANEVREASSQATLFRGYEVILQGRDLRDAIFISSRACGVCGSAHSTASALCLEMAFGIQPPPMGITVRNMLVALESLADNPTHLFTRAGPDYSEPIVRQTNPEIWTRAEQTPAPGVAFHGYERIGDIMTALTRFSGELYEESLQMSRLARESFVFTGGKYPHPQTIAPGGLSSTLDPTQMNLSWLRIVEFIDYSLKVVAVWDDLVDFFYEADPRFREVGTGPKNFLDLGAWDDPLVYDGTYQNSPLWGEQRWSTPGAIVDGQLRTTNLQQINIGIEEFVDRSFYADWTDGAPRYPTDPVGNALSPYHPWNKRTIPEPSAVDWQRKYSWATAARWDRKPMETGAYARLWATALANKLPHRRFLEPTGHSLKMAMPQSTFPETVLEWHAPENWGALERNRARAYALAHATLVAYESALNTYDFKRKGGPDAKVFTHYEIPRDSRAGAGLWGGARGYVSHHMTMDKRVIENYEILGPSTFTASPADPFGNRGPMEEAVAGTPLLSTAEPERYVDVLRAIRSFDPCLTCTTH